MKTMNYYDIENFKSWTGSSLMIVGKRGCGKTTLAKNIAYKINDDVTIFNIDFDQEKLQNLVNYQKYQIEDGKMKEKVLIFDDFNNSVRENQVINEIINNGKHYGFTIIFVMQDIYALSKYQRSQFDALFMLRSNSSNMDRIYKSMNLNQERKVLTEKIIDGGYYVLKTFSDRYLTEDFYWTTV
jgi:DNA replication protein DnaC